MDKKLSKTIMAITGAAMLGHSTETAKLPESVPTNENDLKKITVVEQKRSDAFDSRKDTAAYNPTAHAEATHAQDLITPANRQDPVSTPETIVPPIIHEETKTAPITAAAQETKPFMKASSVESVKVNPQTFSQHLEAALDSMLIGKNATIQKLNVVGNGNTLSVSITVQGAKKKNVTEFLGNLVCEGGKLIVKNDYKLEGGFMLSLVPKVVINSNLETLLKNVKASIEHAYKGSHSDKTGQLAIEDGNLNITY